MISKQKPEYSDRPVIDIETDNMSTRIGRLLISKQKLEYSDRPVIDIETEI